MFYFLPDRCQSQFQISTNSQDFIAFLQIQKVYAKITYSITYSSTFIICDKIILQQLLMSEGQLDQQTITKKFNARRLEICTTAKRERRDHLINQKRLQYLSEKKSSQQPYILPFNQFISHQQNNFIITPFQEAIKPQQREELMGYSKEQFFNMINAHMPQPPPTSKYQIPTKAYRKQLEVIPKASKPVDILKNQNRLASSNRQYIMTGKILGEGAESIVYEGIQKAKGRKVAIKMLTSHYTDNQIQIMKSMPECENVLKLYDYWIQNGKMFMSLELCEGNLQDLKEKVGLTQRYQYFSEILNGMRHLDRNGILHRDIKLYNILVKNGKVKLSDFGFAKHIGTRLTIESRQCGTPATMAPEVFFAQQKGKVVYDRKTDIWPLGIVLHQLVYGSHPFNYDVKRMEKGERIKVKTPIEGIEKILNKILVINTHARLSLFELSKMFDAFMKQKAKPIVIEQNQKLKDHCFAHPAPFKQKVEKQKLSAFQRRKPISPPLVIPSLFPRQKNNSINTEQDLDFTARNLATKNQIPKTTKANNMGLNEKASFVNLVKIWLMICLCIYVLRLALG